MFLFIMKMSVLNIWRQRVRYGGVALCIFLFTVALLISTELSAAVRTGLEETGSEISEMEYEVLITGSESWEAQQGGDIIQNISNPLLIAGACVRLLLAFLWMGAFTLIFAILYMILNERMHELRLWRLLGFSRRAVLMLLFIEAVVLSVTAGSVSYVVGDMILYAVKPVILNYLSVSTESVISTGGALPQYLLVYFAAEVGASVWFMGKAAKEL